MGLRPDEKVTQGCQLRAQTVVQESRGVWGGETCTHKYTARLCKNEKEFMPCALCGVLLSPCLQDHLKCLCCQVFLLLGYVRAAVFKRDWSNGQTSPLCLSCSVFPHWQCWQPGDMAAASAPGAALCVEAAGSLSNCPTDWSEPRDSSCQASFTMSEWDFVKDSMDLGWNLLHFAVIPDLSRIHGLSAFTGGDNIPLPNPWHRCR